ncbi:hypothetical protein F0P96_14485 [Hymenobacter busanensis]|uniref:Uncharacterized protein n=1 Tax=Hymenobacter busanensis TaxID=2607656 RepID=A0A7L5A2D9_9BACT|nr:DUF6526 family protein [Hymenobacter busanensis]KAA9331448.1 hypothetical protein F0P96_14485 [Hymenobacter busanensis]QHJ08602.1 hypothetical protein GUY19_15415 [Hymenobacter busanensis]
MADSPRFTRRYYWPHHFVVLPAALVLTFYAGRRYAAVAGADTDESRLWFTLAAVAATLLGTIWIMRQHYALTLQDRLARLEVRQRYFELTGQRFQPVEARLSLSQILSLRFASDAELPNLAAAAAAEKLAPAAIRERIQQFQPDSMRV